jgi:hypothetical protein
MSEQKQQMSLDERFEKLYDDGGYRLSSQELARGMDPKRFRSLKEAREYAHQQMARLQKR